MGEFVIGMADSIGIILPAWGNGIPNNAAATAPDATPSTNGHSEYFDGTVELQEILACSL